MENKEGVPTRTGSTTDTTSRRYAYRYSWSRQALVCPSHRFSLSGSCQPPSYCTTSSDRLILMPEPAAAPCARGRRDARGVAASSQQGRILSAPNASDVAPQAQGTGTQYKTGARHGCQIIAPHSNAAITRLAAPDTWRGTVIRDCRHGAHGKAPGRETFWPKKEPGPSG